MRKKLKERTSQVLKKRAGKPSLGPLKLKLIRPGSLPKNTKKTGPRDHRPRVLSVCPQRRAAAKAWYFSIYVEYRRASKRYREGDLSVQFPPGTYKPPLFSVAFDGYIS
jgi:hypothetical protein